jgi:hypothetical protein
VINITCIVGIVDKSFSTPRVLMAADSGASDESIMTPIMDPKIQKNGKYLIGYAGETGLGQLLHSIDLPDPNVQTKDLLRFMRTKFALSFKNAMNLYSPSTSPADDKDGGLSALIAVKGRLFEFNSDDFQFNEYLEGAIGSGSHLAFGSLYTTRGYKDINRRLKLAVEAAIEYSPSCKGPIVYDYI